MTKKECQNIIYSALLNAQKNGFKIYVASDEEGNSWNLLNPDNMFYGDTNEDSIALGVWQMVDEDNIFVE